mgnify:CR=1 FL=1
MKYTFNKVVSAITSAAMIASTVSLAAAANYPAPFVQNGVADVAVVYGSPGVAAQTDLAAVVDITADLEAELATQASDDGETTVTGGDFVMLSKSSEKLNLGDTLSGIFGSTVDDDDLEDLLADGTYTNDENAEFDYEQKITIGALTLTHFSDKDYREDRAPAVGIHVAKNTFVMNYTVDFTSDAESDVGSSTSGCSDGDLCDIETTDLPLLGKTYYVSDADNSTLKLTLLDSANSANVNEGETVSVAGYDVSIHSLTTTEARLVVDGEITNELNEGESYKLDDGTYVGIKDIFQRDVAGVTGSVEFSLGSGKLEINGNSNTVELNDETVEGIKGYVERGTPSSGKEKIDKIVLEWIADDEGFIAEDSELVMPGFGAIKISMGDFIQENEETISISRNGQSTIEMSVPIEDGTASFDVLSANATGEYDNIGGDSTGEDLVTSSNGTIVFNESDDEYFIATYNSSREAESYLLSASISKSDNRHEVAIKNEVTGTNVCEGKTNGTTCDIGDVSLNIIEVSESGADEWVHMTAGTNVNFNTLFTKEGLKVYMPIEVDNGTQMGAIDTGTDQAGTTAGHNADSFIFFFTEEDRDGTLAAGTTFNITVNDESDGDVEVGGIDTGQSEYKVNEDSDDYVSMVQSELATTVKYLSTNDEAEAEVIYAGEEAYGEVYLTATDAEVVGTGVTDLGSVSVTDAEVSSVSGKNLIVVGGSCVNTVAAELLGSNSPMCGDSFTAATGVGAGEFLIQTFSRSGGKVATLVAGYNAADTTNAAKALTTQDISTDVDSKYMGTSATSIEAVVA